MTVDEIFAAIGAHMAKGVKIHWDFTREYSFLCLKKYEKEQYKHFLEETDNYYKVCSYHMEHYHKLLDIKEEDALIIPVSWYKYTQFDVDVGTKRTAIKDIMEKWIAWERETKSFLSQKYTELYNLNEIAAAKEIKKYIADVDDELAEAEKQYIELETIGYDMGLIIDWQNPKKR